MVQSKRNRAIVFVCATWSGFYVMSLELLGGRVIAPYYGNSIYVWGAIITVFMVSLAAGYYLGGALSTRNVRLATLAVLLVAAALAAVPLVVFGDPVLDWLSAIVPDPRSGSLAATTLLFLLPAMVSGTVSPFAVRLLTREDRMSGYTAGVLYFLSTAGSAAGTLITSFYLVLLFETSTILALLSGISVAVGCAALAIGHRR